MIKNASKSFAGLLFCVFIFGSASAENISGPGKVVMNLPTLEDGIKINQLLANYTKSVSGGDFILFESQLLDVNIPFSGIAGKAHGSATADLKSIQNYAEFKKTIFESGEKFEQRFSNVKIEQLGSLAQVSLDYETTLQGAEYAGKGWKVIQLIKVNNDWKIASEFFTGYPNASGYQD